MAVECNKVKPYEVRGVWDTFKGPESSDAHIILKTFYFLELINL